MNSVKLPSALAGAAALALVLGTPAYAQQTSGQQGQATQSSEQQPQQQGQAAQTSEQQGQAAQGSQQQGQANQQSGQQAQQAGQQAQQSGQQAEQSGQQAQQAQPQGAGFDAGNQGAIAQIIQQLEQAQKSLEEGNVDEARATLGEVNEMVQTASIQGPEAEVLEVQAQLQQAMTALDQDDTETAQAAIGGAAEALVAVQEQMPQQGSAQASGQQPRQGDQQVTTAQGQTDQGGGVSREGLWNAQDALDMARQEVESALRSLEEAQAALQEYGSAAGGAEGNARVTIIEGSQETAGSTAQATPSGEAQMPRRLSEEETYRLLGMGDRQVGEATEMLTLTAADMQNRRVVTFQGDRIGEINRMVENGGQLYAVIEHGGFLGIGENRVAIPGDRLGMRGEDIVLLGLSEEQLQSMPEYDFDSGQELSADQPFEIGRYE